MSRLAMIGEVGGSKLEESPFAMRLNPLIRLSGNVVVFTFEYNLRNERSTSETIKHLLSGWISQRKTFKVSFFVVLNIRSSIPCAQVRRLLRDIESIVASKKAHSEKPGNVLFSVYYSAIGNVGWYHCVTLTDTLRKIFCDKYLDRDGEIHPFGGHPYVETMEGMHNYLYRPTFLRIGKKHVVFRASFADCSSSSRIDMESVFVALKSHKKKCSHQNGDDEDDDGEEEEEDEEEAQRVLEKRLTFVHILEYHPPSGSREKERNAYIYRWYSYRNYVLCRLAVHYTCLIFPSLTESNCGSPRCTFSSESRLYCASFAAFKPPSVSERPLKEEPEENDTETTEEEEEEKSNEYDVNACHVERTTCPEDALMTSAIKIVDTVPKDFWSAYRVYFCFWVWVCWTYSAIFVPEHLWGPVYAVICILLAFQSGKVHASRKFVVRFPYDKRNFYGLVNGGSDILPRLASPFLVISVGTWFYTRGLMNTYGWKMPFSYDRPKRYAWYPFWVVFHACYLVCLVASSLVFAVFGLVGLLIMMPIQMFRYLLYPLVALSAIPFLFLPTRLYRFLRGIFNRCCYPLCFKKKSKKTQ